MEQNIDYLLVILFGILTVGYMIRDHIGFTKPDPDDEELEENEEELPKGYHVGDW